MPVPVIVMVEAETKVVALSVPPVFIARLPVVKL